MDIVRRAEHDRIFSDDALRWVDVILGAIAVWWPLLSAAFLYVGFTADDPGVPLLMVLMLLVGGTVGLLVVVMRSLLRQATRLRTDMEAVI